MASADLSESFTNNLDTRVANVFPQNVVGLADPFWAVGEAESYESGTKTGEVDGGVPYSSWLAMLQLGKSHYHVGAAVLDYCLSHENTRAFVFFSMEDNLIVSLASILSSVPHLYLVYASNLNLSRIGALNLIEHCYGDKAFFTESIREKMTRERFAFSTKAFLLVYELKHGVEEITEIKARLRKTLSAVTFERRIHGTDGLDDTRHLVEAMTNPNTLFLLNRVRVSRQDRLFNRYPASLKGNPNVCIDGSAAMELYGLRKSRDLDLICTGSSLEREVLELGFDINNDHYKNLPISHVDVINNPYLHVRLYGTKFTSIATRQLLLSFGPRSSHASWGAKKMRDLRLISNFYLNQQSSATGLLGHLSTLATQLRLVFEFVINRIMPKLPPSLAGFIRKVKATLTFR